MCHARLPFAADLSILYLRCLRDKLEAIRDLLKTLSILYLRCATKQEKWEREGRNVDFQFSI